jgi:hypothetical protein
MSEQPTWQDLVAAARRKATVLASELAADPRGAAARTLDPALRMMGIPDSALADEIATAVDELVEVVLVQQELIENLLTRVSLMERTVYTRPSAEATG